MVDIIRENTASFIIVFITILLTLTLAYRIYHVDCDPQAVDEFNKFISKFEDCIGENCGTFDYTEIPLQHGITLKSKNKVTSIELFCKGKKGESEIFEGAGLCIYSAADSRVERDLEEIELSRVLNIKYGIRSLGNVIELRKNGDDICFVNPIVNPIRGDFGAAL